MKMENEMTKFTPGPWEITLKGYDFNVLGDRTKHRDGDSVVWLATVKGNATGMQVGEANARLIAAAPDLLAACKQLKFANDQYGDKRDHSIDPDTEWEKALDMIDAAIAKAHGQDAALSSARGDAGEVGK